MRLVIDHIAAVAGEVHRHAAVVADRQGVQQLLEIRPMGLAVSPGDGVSDSPVAASLLGRLGIGAIERDGGGIVMQFFQADLELLDHLADGGQDQGRTGTHEHACQTIRASRCNPCACHLLRALQAGRSIRRYRLATA